MSTSVFPAQRFDGQSAEAQHVLLRVEGRSFRVETPDGAVLESEPVRQASVSEAFEHVPRLIRFGSGATLEVEDESGGLARALVQAGLHPSAVVRLQGWWPAVLVALAGLVALIGLAYFKALPVAARWAAFALPARIEERMGEQLLLTLDKHYLKPSRLDQDRRERLTQWFAEGAARVAPGVPYRLEFRSMGKDGVNAFAFPGGIIVMLDGLVEFANSEDATLGVLGHELGHVVHKHVAREVFQSLGVGVLAGLFWGDFSGTAASVPIVLGMLRYSRAFENEADEFSVTFLRASGVSARGLHDFFTRLQQKEERYGVDAIPEFLSSHSPTPQRIERLAREMAREEAAGRK